MRFATPAVTSSVLALLLAGAAHARTKPQVAPTAPQSIPVERTGIYRLDAGPDVAGRLEITADHHFRYDLAAGALDEEATGTWEFIDGRTCLTTVPAPKPPAWTASPAAKGPTVRVAWPDGTGIAGVGLRVGFDAGDLTGGYTLEDGWALPPDERRIPRWVELIEPVNGLTSPRFPFNGARNLLVTLVPNDLGKVGFDKSCLEPDGTALVLRRGEGAMKFYRSDP